MLCPPSHARCCSACPLCRCRRCCTAHAGFAATAAHGDRSALPVAVCISRARVGDAAADGRTCHLGKPAVPHLVLLFPMADADQTQSQVGLGEPSLLTLAASRDSALVAHTTHDWPCRSAWRRLAPFLPARSTRYIEPGHSVAVLARAERKLGHPRPCELWELYRYRNGQAAHTIVGVQFIDGLRFVRCTDHA